MAGAAVLGAAVVCAAGCFFVTREGSQPSFHFGAARVIRTGGQSSRAMVFASGEGAGETSFAAGSAGTSAGASAVGVTSAGGASPGKVDGDVEVLACSHAASDRIKTRNGQVRIRATTPGDPDRSAS